MTDLQKELKVNKMDDRAKEYYSKRKDKCFDIYYLLDLIFSDGVRKEEEQVYERLAFAFKENNYIYLQEAADLLMENGGMKWGNHLMEIAKRIKNRHLKNSNVWRLNYGG